MIITIPTLEKLITDVLRTQYRENQIDLIKKVVMFGELSGRPSHGILRLIKGNNGVLVDGPRGQPEYIRKTPVSTLIDAKGNPGMLIAPLAMAEAIKLAGEHGVGIVGTKGSVHSTGALAYYCETIAKKNYIAVIFSQASAAIAPFGSTKAIFGTNPMAFGIPSDPNPVIFDMSTSAITFGALMEHKITKKPLPPNVAIDKNGQATTDPEQAMSGATLPFDSSYKGSGLAMMVEILGSLWPGGGYERLHKEDGNGNLFLVFSPDVLSDTVTMKRNMQEFIQTLKSAPTVDGKPIRIPGEHSLKVRDENLQKGKIEVNDAIVEKIKLQLASR